MNVNALEPEDTQRALEHVTDAMIMGLSSIMPPDIARAIVENLEEPLQKAFKYQEYEVIEALIEAGKCPACDGTGKIDGQVMASYNAAQFQYEPHQTRVDCPVCQS